MVPDKKQSGPARKASVQKKDALSSTLQQARHSSVKREVVTGRPAHKLFQAFKKAKQPQRQGTHSRRPAWQPREEDPSLDFDLDLQMQREMDAQLQRHLDQGIKKTIYGQMKQTKGASKGGKVMLPRLEGSKGMDQIDREMSRELQEQMERQMSRHY